ncbi:hypothetical protein Ancab_010365 [Ancistrocladus abbreviatus]
MCPTPLEAVSSYNDAIELPTNGKSGSLNRGRSHTDSSIANGLINPAHLDNIGDRTTITSLGPSKDLINQGLVHSLELQANGTHSNGGMMVANVNQCSSDESRSLQKAPKDLENTGYVETNLLVRRKKRLNTLLKSFMAAPGGKKTLRKVKKKTVGVD